MTMGQQLAPHRSNESTPLHRATRPAGGRDSGAPGDLFACRSKFTRSPRCDQAPATAIPPKDQ
jgi:hypothetical protein